jgi:hypothetical protein
MVNIPVENGLRAANDKWRRAIAKLLRLGLMIVHDLGFKIALRIGQRLKGPPSPS